jgi:hypothetical protein
MRTYAQGVFIFDRVWQAADWNGGSITANWASIPRNRGCYQRNKVKQALMILLSRFAITLSSVFLQNYTYLNICQQNQAERAKPPRHVVCLLQNDVWMRINDLLTASQFTLAGKYNYLTVIMSMRLMDQKTTAWYDVCKNSHRRAFFPRHFPRGKECRKQFCLLWLPRAVDFKVSCSQIPRPWFLIVSRLMPTPPRPYDKAFGIDWSR